MGAEDVGGEKQDTDLDTQVGRSGANETERRADVYFLNNVPCVVRCGVQHAVECEASVVYYVVELAVLPVVL